MKPIITELDGTVAGNAEPTSSARWALVSLSLSMLLSSLDTSIANVALPTLTQAFAASFQEVQWVVIAYLLVITTLIVSVGRLGDIIGRRRLLLAGIVLFTLASVLCGIAPTLWLLIAARAVQGLGGAIMMALTMAIVGETVPKAKTGSAMGLLGTMSAIGTALGPSLGGVLIAGIGWRAIFLVNVPLGILAFLLAHHYLPIDRRGPKFDQAGFDKVGTLLLALTLAAYALAVTIGRGSFGLLNIVLLLAAVFGVGLLRACRGKSSISFDQIGYVPRSIVECEPRYERARRNGGNNNVGSWPVLSLTCTWPRCSYGWIRIVCRSTCRRPDCCTSRVFFGPFRRTPYDHHRAYRNGGRFLHSIHDTGKARHFWLHCSNRSYHWRLFAVPDGQQHRCYDRYPSGPAGGNFRNA